MKATREPWVEWYARSLKAPRVPLVWLLVSQQDARALMAGRIPRRVKAEIDMLLTWHPVSRPARPTKGRA